MLSRSLVAQDVYKHSWLTTAFTLVILAWSLLSIVGDVWRPSPAVDRWTVADWLINYEGGPIRRGFFGEIVLRISSDSQMAAYLVMSFQLLLLAALYTLVFLMFLRTSRSPAWMILVLSPAFLLFPRLSLQGGLRKEIFVLVVLALVASLVSMRAKPGWFLIPLALFSVSAFSHEANALSLPAFLFLFWQACRCGAISSRSAVLLGSTMVCVSVLALIMAAAFPGTIEQRQAICQSLINLGSSYEACAGAISVIGQSFGDGFDSVSSQFPEYLLFLPVAALAIVPFAVLRVPKEVWYLLAVTYATLTPLFLTGIDYGRWIYLATALTSISIMACGRQWSSNELKVPLFAAVLYIALWSLPYTGPVVQQPLVGHLATQRMETPLAW